MAKRRPKMQPEARRPKHLTDGQRTYATHGKRIVTHAVGALPILNRLLQRNAPPVQLYPVGMLNDFPLYDGLNFRVFENATDKGIWLPVHDHAAQIEHDIQCKLLQVGANSRVISDQFEADDT